MTALNCCFIKREDTGKPGYISDQYLQTLYVTSLLRIAGALFLNACKRCSDTSGKIKDQNKKHCPENICQGNAKEVCKLQFGVVSQAPFQRHSYSTFLTKDLPWQ